MSACGRPGGASTVIGLNATLTAGTGGKGGASAAPGVDGMSTQVHAASTARCSF